MAPAPKALTPFLSAALGLAVVEADAVVDPEAVLLALPEAEEPAAWLRSVAVLTAVVADAETVDVPTSTVK